MQNELSKKHQCGLYLDALNIGIAAAGGATVDREEG
jgi:hypothetical protein